MNGKYADLLDHYAAEATKLLGQPCRYVLLTPYLSMLLIERAVREARQPMTQSLPIELFLNYQPGHETAEGFDVYRLEVAGQALRAVQVHNCFIKPFRDNRCRPDIWLVPCADYVPLYKFLRSRRQPRDYTSQPLPIMPAETLRRLQANTIDFLQHGTAQLKKFGVPQKRGLILTGSPGNGKTMACRWLREQCERLDLEWRQVTIEDYSIARGHNELNGLFELDAPGIILFDDFDLGMRDREKYGATQEHCGMLSQLDGIQQRQGVVYMFTTNVAVEKIDPAFLRRGRIDQVIHFHRPTAELRRRLMVEHWHAEIQQGIDLDKVVATTENCSFAELAELKKLLVMRFVDRQIWDWTWAWAEFQKNRQPDEKPQPIGFSRTRDQSCRDNVNPSLDPISARSGE